MAKLKTIVCFGQSNMEGNASLVNVPAATMSRWGGPTNLAALPVNVTVPGIHYWTARMPSGVADSGTADSATASTLVDAAPAWIDDEHNGRWVFLTGGTGVGQVRLITDTIDGTNTINITPDWTTIPDATTTYVIALDGTNSLSTYTGSFRDLTFYYDNTAPTSYSYATGYEYPNFKTTPVIHTNGHTGLLTFGPDLELSWQIQHELQDDLWVVKLAVSGSYMSKFLGTIPVTSFSWFDSSVHNDWHPTSTNRLTGSAVYDLFDVLVETILKTATQSWISTNRTGDQLDVIGIFVKEGESDSLDTYRADLIGTNMRMIRDTMRQRIADAGLSSRQADKIPWIIAGHDEAVWTYADIANAAFKQMEADDPYTGYVDTNGFATNTGGDVAHLNAASQILLGQRFYEKWSAVMRRESLATTLERNRLTLSQIRTQVLRRYEGNDVSNDNGKQRVNQIVNDALRELYNTLGNNAWFLRRIESVEITAEQRTPFTLPRVVDVLERIERPDRPGCPVRFIGMGYTDSGLLQLMLPDEGAGTYNVHHLVEPLDLATDDDACLVPNAYTEMVVMLACKRLAESAGNATLSSYYAAETERLYKYVKRDCMRHMRSNQPLIRVGGQDDITHWESFDPI